MYHLTKVEIDGFWYRYKVRVPFYKDVNIFIGKNGTGKTTFINILTAVLTVDIRSLALLEFSNVKIMLECGKSQRTITVSRVETDMPFELLKYKIGRNSFTIPVFSREMERRKYSYRTKHYEELIDLKRSMSKLINLSWLSVYREIVEPEEEEYRHSKIIESTPIERRIEDLLKRLTSYQLTLAERANDVLKQFENEVLVSILYDERFEKVDLNYITKIELKKMERMLKQAYSELGLTGKETGLKIENHIKAIKRSISIIKEKMKEKKPSYLFDDVLPLPLLNRTQHIVDFSIKAENEKKKIFGPINNYLNQLKDFIQDKKFTLIQSGSLIIEKDNTEIPLTRMSSGEKQLFILLTETLLQKNEPFMFFADEPELSLHIEWQEKIVSSIRDLNPNSQIIVATHSPEIAGRWRKNMIDMEDIIK